MKYYVGVELGVNHISAGLVDKSGKLVRRATGPTMKERPYQEIVADIAALIRKVLDEEGADVKNIRYIGVGCPGISNSKTGTIIRSYIAGFTNLPLREELQKHFNLHVFIENDANCAALAESVSGAAEDIDHSVLIRIGNGIGGGIIIDNCIYSGFNNAGPEIGHMVIIRDGEQCTCGRKGCWEAYCSEKALLRSIEVAAAENPDAPINRITENDHTRINLTTSFEALKAGDIAVRQAFVHYLDLFATGLTNIVNILMPQAVIIGGEIGKMGEYLLKPLRERVFSEIYTSEVELPEFKIAEMGSAAIIIGAAMLGLSKDNIEEL
ncbi:MAG: ROK family protein [Clostridiales bacterium]|nr:ROK family protein [Clostridiales bacterium]